MSEDKLDAILDTYSTEELEEFLLEKETEEKKTVKSHSSRDDRSRLEIRLKAVAIKNGSSTTPLCGACGQSYPDLGGE